MRFKEHNKYIANRWYEGDPYFFLVYSLGNVSREWRKKTSLYMTNNPFLRKNYIQEMIDGEPTVVEVTECLDPFVSLLAQRGPLPIIDVEEVIDEPTVDKANSGLIIYEANEKKEESES